MKPDACGVQQLENQRMAEDYEEVDMRNRKKLVLWGILLALFMMEAIPVWGEDDRKKVSDARYGVVRIFTVAKTPEGYSLSTGTGFGVGAPGKDADTFVTNWHVVTSSGSFDYKDARVFILLDDQTFYKYEWIMVEEGEELDGSGEYAQDEDGRIYKRVLTDWELGNVVECEVLYAEHQYPDVAILKTKEPVENVETMPLRRVDPYDVGRKIFTIGYPGSADMASIVYDGDAIIEKIKGTVEAVSVAGGDISRCLSLEWLGNTNCIVHHAHINHGNSGGPLILEDGSVIGINTYGFGDLEMEYSVSIYIDYAMEIMDELGISYTLAEDEEEGGQDGGEKDGQDGGEDGSQDSGENGGKNPEKGDDTKENGKNREDDGPGNQGGSGQEDGKAVSGDDVPGGQGKEDHNATGSVPVKILVGAGAAVLIGLAVLIAVSKRKTPALSKTPIPSEASVPAPGESVSLSNVRLQGMTGVFAGRRFQIGAEIRMGRDPQRCDFVYPADTKGISGMHCVIRAQGGTVMILDAGSTYGTFVNGNKLIPNCSYPLAIGDRIRLGSANEEFQITQKGGVV